MRQEPFRVPYNDDVLKRVRKCVAWSCLGVSQGEQLGVSKSVVRYVVGTWW